MNKRIVINLTSWIYFAVGLLVVKAALFPSIYINYPPIIDTVIELLAYSIWLISIFYNKFTKSRTLLLFLIGSSCVLTSIITGSFLIFSSFLLFYISIFLDHEKIVKIIYKCILVVFFLHFGLFLINYFRGLEVPMNDLSGRIRYSIGFNHPNRAAILAVWGFLGYCYCHDSFKKKIIAFLLLMLVFYFTDSRSLLYVGIIYIVLDRFKNKKNIQNLYINMPKIVYLSLVFLSFVSVISYLNHGVIGNFVDKLSNQRIYYSARAYKIYGVTFFGRNIEVRNNLYGVNRWDWLVLDNWYMYCVYGYGICYLFYLYYVCYFVSKEKNINKSLLMSIWCIYAFFELANMNFLIAFAPIFGSSYFVIKKDNNKVLKESYI